LLIGEKSPLLRKAPLGAFLFAHAAFGAGQKTPPCIGRGAPVVVGSESGRPRRERKAR
jgi:hypothetical protein